MKFNQMFLCFIYLILLGHSACADDGGVDVQSGSARLIHEHPTISMVDEYVLIEMLPNSYRVNASFNFYNNAESTTVPVGFPVSGKSNWGDGFKYFKTWVNGIKVDTKDFPEAKEEQAIEGTENYKYFKVKLVDFPAKSTTTTMVQYEATYGYSVAEPSWLKYVYGTGNSWSGPIGLAVFDIRFAEDTLGFVISASDTPLLTHRAPGQMKFEMRNISPSDDAGFAISFLPFSYCASEWSGNDSEHRIQHCSAYSRFNDSDISGHIVRPNYPTLTVLRLMRNALYASHGVIFKDVHLKRFFSNMSWYRPRHNYTDRDLSAQDRERIKAILKNETVIKSTPQIHSPFSIPRTDQW